MYWSMAFGIFGGLGLFLFGMQMMASGMQMVAGDRLRRVLEVLTNRPVIGVLTGLLVTLLIQSSSATAVMVVGFANAGLMNLAQCISVIIGANIGTTVTAQIISFKIDILALPAIGIGAFLIFISKRRLHRYLGQAVLGFGLLFLGLSTMSAGMAPLQQSVVFQNLLIQFGHKPVLGVLCGALFTALIQSSSAATGVIIALSMQNLIPFSAAVPLVLGSNIGTCVTAILASIGTNIPARRTAVAHLLFNVIGVVLILFFIGSFTELLQGTASTVPRQIANAHTAFNLFNAVVFLVFLKPFARLVCHIVPGPDDVVVAGPAYLDSRMLHTPAVAIGGAKKELLRMGGIAQEMLRDTVQAFISNDLRNARQIEQMEDLIDGLEKEINIYLADLSQQSLTQRQSKRIAAFMSAANDLERIGDHCQNILQLAETKSDERHPFSDEALDEISMLYRKVEAMLEQAIICFKDSDKGLALEVIKGDDEIDMLEKSLRKSHIERINTKRCYPPAGVIYLDVISNLERIADHATNIAQLVIED